MGLIHCTVIQALPCWTGLCSALHGLCCLWGCGLHFGNGPDQLYIAHFSVTTPPWREGQPRLNPVHLLLPGTLPAARAAPH